MESARWSELRAHAGAGAASCKLLSTAIHALSLRLDSQFDDARVNDSSPSFKVRTIPVENTFPGQTLGIMPAPTLTRENRWQMSKMKLGISSTRLRSRSYDPCKEGAVVLAGGRLGDSSPLG